MSLGLFPGCAPELHARAVPASSYAQAREGVGAMPLREAAKPEIQRSLCQGANNVELLASTLIHEADHLCHGITGEWNPDALGSANRQTDECHATGTERNCGFSPDPVTISTGCLVFQ